MVLMLLGATFVLSLILGIISKNKIKYFYPIVTAMLFIPSIFIYYNKSALIYGVWYFVVSASGMIIGIIINKVLGKQ